MTGWPDERRPGVPLHPERARLHWFRDESGAVRAVPWIVHHGSPGFWSGTFHHGLTYLGPCLTPDEVQAQLAAAREGGQRAAVDLARCEVAADLYQQGQQLGGAWMATVRMCIARLQSGHSALALDEVLAAARREALEEARKAASVELEHHFRLHGGMSQIASAAIAVDFAIRALAAGQAVVVPAPLCDCERAHNGIGMVGRLCDCQPASPYAPQEKGGGDE